MKNRMLPMLLAAVLIFGLGGCSRVSAEGVRQTGGLPAESQAAISRDEAQSIALKHAGFTADQVSFLRTEYEIDDGRPQYEVSFHEGRWEYDYEIDAQTGEILSFDRDD